MLDIFSRGGLLMYPLLACSLIALTVIIDRVIFLIRARGQGGVAAVEEIVDRRRRGELLDIETSDSLVGIFAAEAGAGGNLSVEAIEAVSQEHLLRMKRGLVVLDTVVTVAPLLGILGTVLGIIDSFDVLGRHGIDEPRLVANGLAKALITTAAGLSIAVPTLIVYNYLVSRVTGAARRLEKCMANLITINRGTDGNDQA